MWWVIFESKFFLHDKVCIWRHAKTAKLHVVQKWGEAVWKFSQNSSVLFFCDGFLLKVFQAKDFLCFEIWSIFGWFMKTLGLEAKSKSLWINSWKQNVDKLLLSAVFRDISASVHCSVHYIAMQKVQTSVIYCIGWNGHSANEKRVRDVCNVLHYFALLCCRALCRETLCAL